MKAYTFSRPGKPSVLQLKDIPEPSAPGPGQVLVQNQTLGLNFAEILSRKGQYSWAPKRPYTPGMECYGTILAVGQGVSKERIGQEVICGMQYGGYAEKVLVPDFMAFPALEGYSPEENAAFLVNYMTAWVALFKQARVEAGETVLVQAAAGGVGTAAVQLLKAKGCTVIGMAGNAFKIQLLKDLGVDLTINYREEEFDVVIRNAGLSPSVVLELVGGDVFRKSYDLLPHFGRMVVAGFASIPLKKWNPLTWLPTLKAAPKAKLMDMAKRSIGMYATHIGYMIDNREVAETCFSEMASFASTHNIKPVVGKVFPFSEIPEAHSFIESRQSHGKVVISLK